tara:strand:+ start:15892 stop:17310 length:1419 start_codon:yes stop_codon:yes gene_type:complete
MRTKIFLVVLLVFFSSSFVFANPVSVEIIESTEDVEAGSDAKFKVLITNNRDERDVFRIFGDDFAIYPFSDFAALIKAEPSQVKLSPEESAEVLISIQTLDTARVNQYYTTKMKVSSLINPEEKTIFEVVTFVVSAKDVIELIPNFPERTKPGVPITVPLKLKNRAYIPMENIEVYLSSDVPNTAENKILNFKEREEFNEDMVLTFNKDVSPGIHTISVRAYQGEELRGSFAQDIIVVPDEDVAEDLDVSRGFLSSLTIIKKKNDGNIVSTQRMETKYSLFKRVFTSTTPKAEKESGKYVWELTLEPGEEAEIQIKTNYRPLFYGLIIIVLFVIGMLFYIERSVVLKKRIFRIKEDSHGISEFKILLHLRNGKRFGLRDVKVLDVLPHVISATQDFGTLKPTTVQKGKMSVRMVWEIGDLDPKEERVISYKVKSKINLLGEVRLPAATVQFINQKGSVVELKSLKLRVIKKE